MNPDLQLNVIENKNQVYERTKLTLLNDSENKIINIQQSKILENKFGSNIINEFKTVNLSHLYFYFYKCESVNDRGWGCAWRSMQSVLKYQLSLSNQNKDKEISFYNLFMKYGDKNTLIDIFMKMTKDKDNSEVLNKLINKKFAPHETDCGWAEPFISQLVLYDFGFEGEILLINNYYENNYAPKEVFSNTLDFAKFKEKLKNHFSQKNPGPIILDDSYISISIIGVKFNEENKNIELLIMDPHAVENPKEGIYIIVLDNEGRQINIIPDKKVLASLAIVFSQNKPWMAYFPKAI